MVGTEKDRIHSPTGISNESDTEVAQWMNIALWDRQDNRSRNCWIKTVVDGSCWMNDGSCAWRIEGLLWSFIGEGSPTDRGSKRWVLPAPLPWNNSTFTLVITRIQTIWHKFAILATLFVKSFIHLFLFLLFCLKYGLPQDSPSIQRQSTSNPQYYSPIRGRHKWNRPEHTASIR